MPRSIVVATLVFLLAPACANDALSPGGTSVDRGAIIDLGEVRDGDSDGGASCGSLAECACRTSPVCMVVADPCYCEFPQCGPGACLCSGGRYIGCSPLKRCPAVRCGPIGIVSASEVPGCFRCDPPTTCAAARAQLKASCKFSEAGIGGLLCDKNPDCVLQCMKALKTCDEVGCGFCEVCDCGGGNPFDQCVRTCWM